MGYFTIKTQISWNIDEVSAQNKSIILRIFYSWGSEGTNRSFYLSLLISSFASVPYKIILNCNMLLQDYRILALPVLSSASLTSWRR